MPIYSPLKPAVAGLLIALGGTVSFAREPASRPVLEEVIVTATRREQNLQDIAVAVTALSDEQLREAQIYSSADLTFLAPSLSLQQVPFRISFAIRGIASTNTSSLAEESSVSTLLDGVVLGRPGMALMQLWDVQRVEVLRGPQGTLFGKNATAGVVHIITRDPSEEHSGEIMGTLVSGDEYRAGLTVSGPLTESLGYRFAAIGSDVAGYTKNYYDGDYLNGSQNWSVRGKLRWYPTDVLELKWTSDYSEQSCACVAAPLRSLEPYGGNEDYVQKVLDTIAPVVPGEENQAVNINQIPFGDASAWGHSLATNWEIGEYALSSITAFRAWDGRGFRDEDSQPINVLGLEGFFEFEQSQLTQEFRVTSPAYGPLSYVAGLYYFDQHVDFYQRQQLEIIPGHPGIAIADFEVNTKHWALYGEATWRFSDSWRLVLGGRYTEDKLDFQLARSREGLALGLPPAADLTAGSTRENDLSGKLALQWDYSDQGMAYLSFSQGYKGPAFDVQFATDPVDLPRVDPETVDAWELGVKTSLFHDRLRLDTALFYAVYKDFQTRAFFDPDGPADCPQEDPLCRPDDDPGSFVLINAGQVSSRGVELGFLAQVTEGLRLTGGVAYIDAKIDDYPAGPCSGGQVFRGECPDGRQDLSGGDLPYSPNWKGNLTAAYTVAMGGFDTVLLGSVRAQDDVQYSLTQDENTIEDGYAIFDASVAFRDQRDRWQATVFVKNIGDTFYVSSIRPNHPAILANGYNHTYAKEAGRTVGLELRYRW